MEGVFTALVTPFNEEGKVDVESFQKLIESQEKGRIDGVVIGGTTGEGWSLSLDEVELLYNICRAHFSGKVVIGTGAISTAETLKKTSHAKSLGADAALVIVPFYNCPTEDGVYEHFKQVSGCGIDLILYHHPKRTSVKLSEEGILRIRELDRVVAIKESSEDDELISSLSKKVIIFSGNDPVMKKEKALGCKGVVSVISNLFPEETKRFFNSEEKDEEWRYKKVLENLYLETNPCGIKAALSKDGLIQNRLRLPLKPYTDKARKRLFEAIKKSYHKEFANN